MTPVVETEAPVDPALANRYPSMPGGRLADRRVPRFTADEPDVPADEAARLRARYSSMFEAKPAAPAAKSEAEPPTEMVTDTPNPRPEASAELPPQYAGLAVPEGYELGEGFAPIARELAEAGYSRAQVEKAIELHTRLEAQTDEHLERPARAAAHDRGVKGRRQPRRDFLVRPAARRQQRPGRRPRDRSGAQALPEHAMGPMTCCLMPKACSVTVRSWRPPR
jgi:hypothetical protein